MDKKKSEWIKKKKSDPLYFTSQMILKLTQSSGVSNKSTAMSVELCMSFFPTQTV